MHNIDPFIEQKAPLGARYFEQDVLEVSAKKLGSKFQAVYMDPPLCLPGEIPRKNQITLAQLTAVPVPDLIPGSGFLFVWIEKEMILDMLRIAEKWGFHYVENFCWIKKNVSNKFVKEPYTYFNKSKLTMLVLRKDGDIELRHQRNPDCVFDFVKPRENNDRELFPALVVYPSLKRASL